MQLRVGDQPAAVRTLAGVGGQLVEIVVPVHNEERVLETSVWRLHGYLEASFPFSFRITIADNASTDATWLLAKRLAERLPGVRAVHVPQQGRGRALRQVWGASDAAVVAYMDADLSTGLEALLPLVAPLLSGHSDPAIGTRLANGAAVVRPAGAACSGPRSAARSPGCSRRRCSCWRPGCG
jgi:cellulose synthase/poly-beta-1,6-N-acetylglucosamine synthase-like glycosyltransferase